MFKLICQGHETAIVLTQHDHINIIIPRNISFMTNYSKHCSGPEIMSLIMFLANLVERKENVVNTEL